MRDFYSDSRVQLSHPGCLYIDGQWVPASSDLKLISPSDEQQHSVVAGASIEDVNRAVAAARHAFDFGSWPRMTFTERAVYLEKMATLLRQRAPHLAACWSLQTGVPITMASHMLADPGMLYDYYAGLGREEGFTNTARRDNGGVAITRREPVGVVAAIAPWNHPAHLMSLKVAPALAMGCTVVAKAAPESPLDVFIFAECAEAAGIPPGVFNIVPADREASDHLVRHPGIDKVSFTGSSVTGAHIASLCAARMVRSSMELGGKSAAIVLDDISIEDVIKTLVPASGVHMAGQGCAFLTRVLVSRKRRDELAEAYAAALRSVKIGDAFDPQTQMGPIAMKRQLERITGYIEKGRSEGARIVTGGGRPQGLDRGYFIEPTLFVDVTNDMAIAQEEIFGPVISMIAFDDEEEAIAIANDSAFGLNGAVYTSDIEKAYAIGCRIRAGNFAHNGLEHDSKFAFGGYKLSGTGREGGRFGMDLYAELKTVYMREAPVGVSR
ncbi:aldehyde dehydrogenase [Pseudomonas sp. NFX98]|uniref:aldehyde dehydrogenase n=1 Tax=Pseudomonas sp. NFX98 TaxID=3399122 RepID=UPI0039FBC7A1